MSRVDAPEGEAGRPCSEVHEGLPMSLSGMHEVPLLRAQEFGCIMSLCWECWQCALVGQQDHQEASPSTISVGQAFCMGRAGELTEREILAVLVQR